MTKQTNHPLLEHDESCCTVSEGLIGVDEAGRGCLAGPVVAGAVYLPRNLFADSDFAELSREVTDSKKLSSTKREALFGIITLWQELGARVAVAEASVDEIEYNNIFGATKIAMARAVEKLEVDGFGKSDSLKQLPLFADKNNPVIPILIDGRQIKDFPYSHHGVVKGDTISLAIAAASIMAKVTRDHLMEQLDKEYPEYGFAKHKGYGTAQHRDALTAHGPCLQHRRSFLNNFY